MSNSSGTCGVMICALFIGLILIFFIINKDNLKEIVT